MTVRVAEDGTIVLEHACPLEDADRLLQKLLADPAAAIDWRGCERAHTAVVQVLLASRRTVHGPPRMKFLEIWIELLLTKQVGP